MFSAIPEFQPSDTASPALRRSARRTPEIPPGPQPIQWARVILIITCLANTAASMVLISTIEKDPVRGGIGVGGLAAGLIMLAVGWCVIRTAECAIYLAEQSSKLTAPQKR